MFQREPKKKSINPRKEKKKTFIETNDFISHELQQKQICMENVVMEN
jgi:hypothetical protein